MDDCDILDDLSAVNCQTISSVSHTLCTKFFFSFYWAYKSSTIDGLEVRVSQSGIIVSILICALTFITDKQNRAHTDNKYSTKKSYGQFNWIGRNHGFSQPTHNMSIIQFTEYCIVEITNKKWDKWIKFTFIISTGQNILSWCTATHNMYPSVLNEQANLSSEYELNFKICIVRWKKYHRKIYRDTHSPKYSTMKFWSSKYETQVNTKIPYAIRFTLFIYIAITCDICKIRLNHTVGTERLMICFCFFIMSL